MRSPLFRFYSLGFSTADDLSAKVNSKSFLEWRQTPTAFGVMLKDMDAIHFKDHKNAKGLVSSMVVLMQGHHPKAPAQPLTPNAQFASPPIPTASHEFL